jgi:hypothetical protein
MSVVAPCSLFSPRVDRPLYGQGSSAICGDATPPARRSVDVFRAPRRNCLRASQTVPKPTAGYRRHAGNVASRMVDLVALVDGFRRALYRVSVATGRYLF